MTNIISVARRQGLAEVSDEAFGTLAAQQAAVGMTPIQVAMRRKWFIFLFALIMAVVTGIAIRGLTPQYTASAVIVVDARQMRVSGGESLLASPMLDLDTVRTRMEELRSPVLALMVVQQLGLVDDVEYCQQGWSWTDRLQALGARLLPETVPIPPGPAACPSSEAFAAKRLRSTISISNDGRSYAIQVSAVASSALKAAAVANSYATAFVERRRDENVGLTKQATAWLTGHLAELRTRVMDADEAVEQQRNEAQITLQRGETVASQSLAELNSQLTATTSDLQSKRSTLAAMTVGRIGADASAVAQSSIVVQQLSERVATQSAVLAELQAQLSSNHPKVLSAKAQLDQLGRQLQQEVGKSVNALRGEVDSLEARRGALASAVAGLQQRVSGQGPANMRLRDLQSDATSARKQYDAAAVRLEQIQADAATQRSDVQLQVNALPPDAPSFPRTNMITVGAFIAALGLGTGLAFARELMSRVFNTPGEVEQTTGVPVIGLFAAPRSRRVSVDSLMEAAPRSPEAEAIHAILGKLLRDPRQHERHGLGGRVVLIASAKPGEGKTAFSLALAHAAVARGLSVGLLDCDTRHSRLAKLFPDALPAALLEPVRADATPLAAGLSVVSMAAEQTDSRNTMCAEPIARAVERLRAKYDLVVLDTAPLLVVPDTLDAAALAHYVVMLTAWRSSSRKDLLSALQVLQHNFIDITGIVITKVKLKSLSSSELARFYLSFYPGYH